MAPARLSTMTAEAAELNGVSSFTGKQLGWVRTALRHQETLVSPLHRVLTIAQHANELTPGSEKLTGNALRAILAPMPLPSFMDAADAKDCLEYVKVKVVTRAAQRKAEAEAAAAAKEARLMKIGTKRAATRAAIAARPVKLTRCVSNTGRVWYE